MSEMNVDMLPAVFGPAIPESGSLETTAYCQSLYSVQVTLSLYKARRNRRRMAVQLHSVLTSASEVRGQRSASRHSNFTPGKLLMLLSRNNRLIQCLGVMHTAKQSKAKHCAKPCLSVSM